MTFRYSGKITKEVLKCFKDDMITLKWDNPNLEEIIFGRVCPNCKNKLYYGDKWFDQEKVVVFKRLCPICRKIYILAGHFEDYVNAKEYFINAFRMNAYNKKRKMEVN